MADVLIRLVLLTAKPLVSSEANWPFKLDIKSLPIYLEWFFLSPENFRCNSKKNRYIEFYNIYIFYFYQKLILIHISKWMSRSLCHCHNVYYTAYPCAYLFLASCSASGLSEWQIKISKVISATVIRNIQKNYPRDNLYTLLANFNRISWCQIELHIYRKQTQVFTFSNYSKIKYTWIDYLVLFTLN